MRDIFQLLEILIQLIAKRVELLNRVRVDTLPFKYFLRTAMSPPRCWMLSCCALTRRS
jgi:hypothetical protein